MSDHTESIAALGQCRRCGATTRQAQPYCYECALLQLDEERAAHAAQLVALREAAVMWDEAAAEAEANYEPSGLVRWYKNMAGRIRTHPLPDAEAALARVREEAVRDFLAKEPSGEWVVEVDGDTGESGWWIVSRATDDALYCLTLRTKAEADAVANALNALGGGA